MPHKSKSALSEEMNNASSVERIHITLSPRQKEKIEEIKQASGAATASEIIRHALIVYAAILDAHQKGDNLYIKPKDEGAPIERLRLFL